VSRAALLARLIRKGFANCSESKKRRRGFELFFRYHICRGGLPLHRRDQMVPPLKDLMEVSSHTFRRKRQRKSVIEAIANTGPRPIATSICHEILSV
jgi:hypothetical protein